MMIRIPNYMPDHREQSRMGRSLSNGCATSGNKVQVVMDEVPGENSGHPQKFAKI
jgi:hypothetical protein